MDFSDNQLIAVAILSLALAVIVLGFVRYRVSMNKILRRR